MSTQQEQMQAIAYSVQVAERRLKELQAKTTLTREEVFEKDMTEDCIRRGKAILKGVQAV